MFSMASLYVLISNIRYCVMMMMMMTGACFKMGYCCLFLYFVRIFLLFFVVAQLDALILFG